MGSKLDQLREMTVVVADTGDIDAIRTWRPVDCTANHTLLLKAIASRAVQSGAGGAAVGARPEGFACGGDLARGPADQLAVSVSKALTRIVPGRVSTEVDRESVVRYRGTAQVKRPRGMSARPMRSAVWRATRC